jgi:hypothetical protein
VTQSTDQMIAAKMGRALYSSGVQQPARAPSVLDNQPHTRQAARLVCEQGRAAGLHPDGYRRAVQSVCSSEPPGWLLCHLIRQDEPVPQ